MRIIYTAEYQEEADVRADSELATAKIQTGLDTLGGLFVHSDSWHPEGEDVEARVEMGIDLKLLARDRGMYFAQPMIRQSDEDLQEFIRTELRKRHWDDDTYLMIPAGWSFVAPVDVRMIEDKLMTDPKCNFVHVPTEAVASENIFEPIPAEGLKVVGPHFGKLSTFLKGEANGHYVWTNGGSPMPVVKQA